MYENSPIIKTKHAINPHQGHRVKSGGWKMIHCHPRYLYSIKHCIVAKGLKLAKMVKNTKPPNIVLESSFIGFKNIYLHT